MARYRNEDNVLAMFNRFYHMCETREQRTLVLDMKQAFLEIHTADVVPKSEVERWYHEYHVVKDELKQERMEYRATEKLADKYFLELQTAKVEVAREIFEEIEKHILENCCVTDDDVDGIWKHIAELKKKYTEGET